MDSQSLDDGFAAALHRAVCFDVSERTEVEVRGGDRASFLHNFCTQDILNLPVGRGCEALMLDVHGKIVAYVRILARQESLWIDSEPGLGPKIVQHLDRYLITEQVSLFDSTRELTQLHVAGPQAAALLSEAAGCDLGGWVHLQHADLELFDVRCQVRRNDMLSVPGYDLLFAATRNRTVLEGLAALSIPQADKETYHVLRIEAGTPMYGVDVDESNLPQELNRDERLLCFTKGCYLGQETVVRIRDRGHVNRLFVGLRLEGDPASRQGERPGALGVPSPRTAVLQDGKEIGYITSAAWSPRLGAVIALGYVRRGAHQPGTAVLVEDRPARVASLPCVAVG